MARRSFRKRSKRFVFQDIFLTCVLFGLMALAVVWLDNQSSEEFAGNPYVVDGDSLVMNEQKIRLVGIDAPELDQTCNRNGKAWACGLESKQALRKLVGRGGVTCVTEGLDKYDRWLARCRNNTLTINAEMVKQGWAVSYGDYAALENSSRANGRGIWVGDFEMPQDWREAQRSSATSVVSLTMDGWISKFRSIKKRFLW